MLACILSGRAAAEPGVNANEIVLGQAAGFTGSVAGTVKELTAGAKAYFDRVNATGGVHGRKIVLESLDDGFDPKRTPEVVKKLIDEKQVFALFLSRGTPTNEAAYPVLEEAKVPLVGPSTGAMSMYDPPRRYLFPVRASYHSETAKIVAQLVSTGITVSRCSIRTTLRQDGSPGTLNAMKAQGSPGCGEPCARKSRSKRQSPRSRSPRRRRSGRCSTWRRLRQADEEDRATRSRDAVEQQLERLHQEPGRGRTAWR